jgi:hypothetical protein
MAIQDDWSIDYVDRKITYTTAFVDDRPPTIYTVNELYSFLQDTFDEPAQMDDPVPMSAQTPTQYTLINKWFIDDNSIKALYGGSIQTSDWTFASSEGITGLRYASATSAPTSADVGKAVTGAGGGSGVILYVDEVRNVVWVRNTNATQFADGEVVDDDATGTDPVFTLETTNGVLSGECVWANLFSVGSLQPQTEIYVGQEPDYMGGTAFHDADADSRFERRIEKVDEWWDSDVDFATGSPNLLGGAGHFDILIKVQEAGTSIDGGRLAVFSRQLSKIYSSFELIGGVGNFVIPFASTGSDLNAQDGPYQANFASNTGTIVVGDVLENDTGTTPVGRLRAVVTGGTNLDQATGTIEYYLVGENEPQTTTDRTLKQFANLDNVAVRGGAVTFDISGAPSQVVNGPAQAQGITITFGDAQFDVDEDSSNEEYAAIIDCNNVSLADVYKHVMFLCSRGNQDGTVADTQDTLLPSGDVAKDEASEFYRAVGDIVVTWDANAGTGLTEGQLVKGSLSGAYGVVVSATTGATGTGVLTQVKGTFVNNDVVSDIDDGVTNTVTLDAAPTSIVDNTGAPFGTFAGGRWFVAQGIYLQNVPVADANNWETSDLTGTRRAPPTTRTITFGGLVANDRAFLAEVDTAGGIDVTKNQNTIDAGGVSAGAATLTLGTTVALDVPATSSWVRVVDTSSTTGEEYRFYFTSVSGTTVTLDQGAGTSGTATSLGSSTVLNDTGAFTNFGTDSNVRIGMEIRNTTDGSRAVVLRKIDNDSIETTPLSGGTDDTFQASDTWDANRPPVALTGSDTVYFPFIDDVSTGSTLTALIKYVADTDLLARCRFSDPDIGGSRILPFEQLNITLTDADLTVTAIRTSDTIAS